MLFSLIEDVKHGVAWWCCEAWTFFTFLGVQTLLETFRILQVQVVWIFEWKNRTYCAFKSRYIKLKTAGEWEMECEFKNVFFIEFHMMPNPVTNETHCSKPSAGPPFRTSDMTMDVSPLWKCGLSLPPEIAIPKPNPGACGTHSYMFTACWWRGVFKSEKGQNWMKGMKR